LAAPSVLKTVNISGLIDKHSKIALYCVSMQDL
jgi:hypothetical protein